MPQWTNPRVHEGGSKEGVIVPQRRRPRLPMLLGLAALTTGAHFLAAMAHLFGGHYAPDWPFLLMLAVAPFAGLMLAMRGRPRHGAIVLTITMMAATFWTMYSHFWLASDATDTFAYAWVVQMLLAFELQGTALGLLLIVKPEVPRPRDSGEPTL